MTDDNQNVSNRTIFEVRVSVFPALPQEDHLTADVYDILTVHIREGLSTLLEAADLESNLDVIIRRSDAYGAESSDPDGIQTRQFGDPDRVD